MLRTRLKSMELRITELADYLQISRPTMYKFIEYYDSKEFDLINKKVLKLFNYITEHELAGKKNVINYILNNLTNIKDMGDNDDINVIKTIKRYIISNPESKKSQFIVTCVTRDEFDEVIAYLVKITPLLKKRKISLEEEELIKPFIDFRNQILFKKEK